MSNNTIEIPNLTRRQQLLADILWTCGTLESVTQFIDSLVDPGHKRDALLVKELMFLYFLDSVDTVSVEVELLLHRLSKGN